MSRADRFLREAIDGFHRAAHSALLARMRGPGEGSGARHGEAHGEAGWAELAFRLTGNQGTEALIEVRERGELPAHEVEWLEHQVRYVRHAVASERMERQAQERLFETATEGGGRLDLGEELSRIALTEDERHRSESARLLDSVLRPLAVTRVAACSRLESARYIDPPRPEPPTEDVAGGSGQHAGQRQQAPASPSRGSGLLIVSAFDPDVLSPPLRDLPNPEWLDHASAFLERTQDAAEDAVRFLARGKHAGGPVSLHTLLAGLRAGELDSSIGRKQRWTRVSAWLRGLGFEQDLHARVRAEVDQLTVLPSASLALLDVPRDIRIAQSSRDFGVVSDVCAAEGVSRALALSLTHPALPSELRWPIGACTAGVFGTLGMLVWCDRAQLMRNEGLSNAQAERIARLCGTFVLLWTRLCAGIAVLTSRDDDRPEARLEMLSGTVARALCTDAAPGLAGVLVLDRTAARDRALEALAGLASAMALRDRWDADWFRNPRVVGPLRALAARGNAVGPEAMCAELSQGTRGVADSASRALELVS